MGKLDAYVISENATLLQAMGKIEKNRSRAVVVTSGKKAVGLISEGDILRALLNGMDKLAPISSVVVYSFKFLKEKDLEQASALMKEHLFTLLPVVSDDFRLVDVVTLSEVLAHLHSKVSG
jgi:CBS domain-containing protein